jgi:predicted nucleic acid-binding protein
MANLHRHSHRDLLGPIWALRNNLSPYDAAYVALATALDAPLVTTDARLVAAPNLTCAVELV